MRNGVGVYIKEYIYKGEFKDDEMFGYSQRFDDDSFIIYNYTDENSRIVILNEINTLDCEKNQEKTQEYDKNQNNILEYDRNEITPEECNKMQNWIIKNKEIEYEYNSYDNKIDEKICFLQKNLSLTKIIQDESIEIIDEFEERCIDLLKTPAFGKCFYKSILGSYVIKFNEKNIRIKKMHEYRIKEEIVNLSLEI